MTTVTIKISQAIDDEYTLRVPDFLPLEKLRAGACVLTLDEARAVLEDAEFNSDRTVFDVGPYGMPLGAFNAYRALAKQVRAAIDKATSCTQVAA